MIKILTLADLSPHASLSFTQCAEASTLGLKPGEWPTILLVANEVGNGLELHRKEQITHDGDLVAVVYRQRAGRLVVHVIND